jgi:hypothetical protein
LLGIVFLVIRTLSDSWVANQPSFHFFWKTIMLRSL